MNEEKKEEMHLPAAEETTTSSQEETANEPEVSNRRQLITRYGKYAVVAAPLLMFVSKAHAIHSRP
jgi:hypothetical protein